MASSFLWKRIEHPYQVIDGLLVQIFVCEYNQEWAAWIVQRPDGYYYRSFLRQDSCLEGPFQIIEVAACTCLMLQ